MIYHELPDIYLTSSEISFILGCDTTSVVYEKYMCDDNINSMHSLLRYQYYKQPSVNDLSYIDRAKSVVRNSKIDLL